MPMTDRQTDRLMKGIILAGGHGTRLYPITKAMSKQLIPIYDKPMIYYPLSVLMMAGIRDILIITTPLDHEQFQRLLDDGRQWGCHFEYLIQNQPNGIAQVFVLGEKFIGNDRIALILGDNFFYGIDFDEDFHRSINTGGACVFACEVTDPQRFGIVELDDHLQPVSIEEKPKCPKSNYAITGFYFYDNDVIKIAKEISISHRGEYEITDVNKIYLTQKKLHVRILNPQTVWFDMGTFESLNNASQFVRSIAITEGISVGCIEEIAFRMKYINAEQLKKLAQPLMNSGYGEYLHQLLK